MHGLGYRFLQAHASSQYSVTNRTSHSSFLMHSGTAAKSCFILILGCFLRLIRSALYKSPLRTQLLGRPYSKTGLCPRNDYAQRIWHPANIRIVFNMYIALPVPASNHNSKQLSDCWRTSAGYVSPDAPICLRSIILDYFIL